MFRKGEGEDGHDQSVVSSEAGQGEGRGSEVTVIGQGARLEGTVVSAGSLRIDGQVKGKVSAEGDVLLSANSHVEAEIQAQNVTVAGRFKGNIVVTGKAELARGGRVDGNISSKTLVVAEGAVFTGQSLMDQQPGSAGRTASPTTDGATTVASAGDVAVTSTQGSAEPAKIRR